MPQDYNFNDAYILGSGIAKLSRPELLELTRELCRALMDVEGKYHGNIHPENLSRTPEGEVGLGPKADHGPGDWTSDELEYMAPELFWDRDGDVASDVYSIGLLLFAGISGGRLPFFPEGTEDPMPEIRAAALRRRMSGDAIVIPAEAGEKLGEIIKKALSYVPEERFSGPVEMLSALVSCPDGEAALSAAPVTAEKANLKSDETPEYKVDKDFEEKVPQKPKKSKKPVIAVFSICALLIIAALILKSCLGGAEVPEPTSALDAMTGLVSPSPSAEAEPTVIPDATASPEPSETAEPAETAEPTASPTPTPTPAPTPTPSPTPAAESTYELYIEDVSWTDAAENCRKMGGHLVTIGDQEELDKVTALADAYGIKLVWIGFYREVNGDLVWLNDEDIDYYVWGKNEPSVTDTDGTPENYGLLWKWGTYTGWIYNDSRNDPAAEFPAAYSGKIAYICEYEPDT
ncbi:MAG: hypothetical protein EOM54_00865 [Clostridia bacterium]|nr:hypothetical protein [Clostridia bacterium]